MTAISDLITREAADAVRKPLAEAALLPPAAYVNEQIYQRELQEVFQHSWLPVCHVSQLPEPGSYVGRTIVREPVLALRDRDGEIQVFSNVCRHRNAVLADGAGQCKGRITCPYHGWTYGLDGRLLAAPFMDKTVGFDRKDYGLPRIRFEIWNGFVFINLDDDAPALAPQLEALDSMIADYNLAATLAVPMQTIDATWNWKVSLENFTEAYHQPWVHATTAEPSAPAKGARYYENGGDGAPWSAFLIPNAEEIEAFSMGAFKAEGGPVAEDALPTSIHEGALVFNIYPYFHALATPQGTLWLDFDLHQVEHHTMVWRVLFPPEALGDGPDAAIAGVKSFMAPVMDEDVAICRRVGLGVNAKLAQPGRLCHMEKAVHQFHNWWLHATDG